MKSVKIFLGVIALVLGFVGAVTSKTMVDITNRGVKINTTEEFSTVQSNVCDNDRSSGQQCTLSTTGTPLAYQVSAPSQPLFRP